MSHSKYRWLWVAVLVCCLDSLGFAQDESRVQRPVSAPSSDETTLRALVTEFFAVTTKKDLDGYTRLWSIKAPDLAARKKAMEKLFADNEKIEVISLTILKVIVEGEKAQVRFEVEMNVVEAKTGKPAPGSGGKKGRILACVKEEGIWRIWRYYSTIEELTSLLVAAETQKERAALLLEKKELLTEELVRALIGQGSRFYSQGDYSKSLAIFQTAQEIAKQIGDKDGIARTQNNIGVIYYSQGNYIQALECHLKSLAHSEEVGDKRGIAGSSNNIGIIYEKQDDYIRALEYLQKSITFAKEENDKGQIANVLGNIGNVHFDQGNYVQALEYHLKSLALYEEIGDKGGSASELSNIGLIYKQQGNYTQALHYCQKGLELAKELGYKAEMAEATDKIGEIYRLQGNYTQALENHKDSLALRQTLSDKVGITESLNNIGEVYLSRGMPSQALESTERAAEIARQIGDRYLLWQARTSSGKAYRSLDQPVLAHQAFEEAITTIESIRTQVAGGEQEQERFFEEKLIPYHQIVELLLSQNQVSDAFTHAERAKARVLLDVMHSGRLNITKAMTANEQEQERRLNNELISLNSQIYRENLSPQPDQKRLAELNPQLQKSRLDYEAFQTNLYAAHPELKAQRGEAPTLTLEQANALLRDAKTALLEFVVTDDKTFLFALSKRGQENQATVGIKVYTIEIKSKDLAERTERFRQMLATVDNRFSKPAHELYNLLLKPATEQLQGKTRLVIVPDGSLWELPFQALQTPQNRYLIEVSAISYVPSLTVLREMIKSRSRETKSATVPTLLAFGNPALGQETVARVKSVLMDEKLDPLPEAEKQVQTLSRIYGPNQSKVYVGAEAREERFKAEAGNYRILHLATHGILNDQSPMYSHLLLAQTGGSGNEDGLLEAWELMKLDLKAELAVLSACETARGRVGKGEGMIGLTWALFVAGCPTTVVSQWKVRSDSTERLMVEFHHQLNSRIQNPKSPATKAEALREAELKLMRNSQYQHPFHWAGFVLVGDGF